MATITAALVKDLREKTGAGMMDCKNALGETAGDIEAAIDWLRKKGLAKAAKKSGRVAADGLVGVAVEANFGVVVEVNSETDFVARNDDFQALVRGILAVALDKGAGVDAEAVKAAHYPGGGTVAEAIANAIATIGENMTLRRAQGLHVAHGAIGHYVHGQIADGLGRIGVIVALESTGDRGALVALGRQVAMHVAAASPIALDAAGDRSGDHRARKIGAGREERRQAAARAGKDRRIGPQDLLQGSLPPRSALRPRPRQVGRPGGQGSGEDGRRADRDSAASFAMRSARASKNRPRRRRATESTGRPTGRPFRIGPPFR